MLLVILWSIVTFILIGIAAIAVLNTLTFPRLRSSDTGQTETVRVSVLIPARNEAAVIADAVRALLAQRGVTLELLVLDDHSDDGTAAVALDAASSGAAAGNTQLRVLNGEPLPPGWLGKNWACHQLAEAAAGDVLVFTDADVCWQPNALAALLAELEHSQADMLTVWPTQITVTWGERLVVPLMAMVILGYLPSPLVHHTRWAAFAAANGQCLAFRRAAYQTVGGHAAVRDQIVEDITLARRAKRAGLRLWMADGNGLIACRMYGDWAAVRDGYAKNIIAGYGGKVRFLALAALFHWLVFLAPWLWLLVGWRSPELGYPAWPLALIALGVLVRALTAAATRQRLRDALLLPVSVLLMTVIAGRAVWWQWRYGGPRWKGRTLTHG